MRFPAAVVARSALGFAVSALLLWLIARRVDLAGMIGVMDGIAWGWLCAAFALLLADYLLRVVRWWLMLRASDPALALARCAGPLMIGVAANNLLPLRAGDALRAFGFLRQLGAPPMRVVGTLAIERVMDALSVLILLGLAIGAGAGLPAHRAALPVAGVLAVALLALLFVALCRSEGFRGRLRRVAEARWLASRGWDDAARRHVAHLLEALELLGSARHALVLLSLSLLVWILEGGVFALVALALDIHDPVAALLALGLGTLATLVPSAPGFIGTFDLAVMAAMQQHGVDATTAAAYAAAVHLLLWLPLTLIGVLFIPFTGPVAAGGGLLRGETPPVEGGS